MSLTVDKLTTELLPRRSYSVQNLQVATETIVNSAKILTAATSSLTELMLTASSYEGDYALSKETKIDEINTKIMSKCSNESAMVLHLTGSKSEDNNTRLSGLKFLIVDDNPINILILKKLLKKLFRDCIIDTTAYSQEVLNQLFISESQGDIKLEDTSLIVNPNFNYDILFFDIEMPLITGVDLAKKIRAYSEFQNLPIVAVTSRNTDNDKKLFEKVGIDRTIGKPLSSSIEKVIKLVNDVLKYREI